MHRVSEIIGQVLIDLGLAFDPETTSVDWNVFSSREPDYPDNCITIYDTEGILQGRTHVNGEVQEQEAIQVRVRSSEYTQGIAKINAIVNALDESVYRQEVTLQDHEGTGTTTYTVQGATRRSSILYLGEDPDNAGRDLFTANYTVSFS